MRGLRLLSLVTVLIATACTTAMREAQPTQTISSASSPTPTISSSSTIAVGHSDESSSLHVGIDLGVERSTAGGIKWTPPQRWTLGPEQQMRVATYLIPAANNDVDGGECAVFYFGHGEGGGVEANIERWMGQFEQSDGHSSADRVKQKKETINNLTVTTIDLIGTYIGGGQMMGGSGEKKPGYRLLGAIIEGQQGTVFFKLTGPTATVAKAENEFYTLIKSLQTK